MDGHFKFEISENKETIIAISVGLDLSNFSFDENDKDDDFYNLPRALHLNRLYQEYSSVFRNKEYFANFIKFMYKKRYINDEVIKIVKTFSENKGLLFILEVEFPNVRGILNEETIKRNKLSEVESKLMDIEMKTHEIKEIFMNLDKHHITIEDLKEQMLYNIYQDWIKV